MEKSEFGFTCSQGITIYFRTLATSEKKKAKKVKKDAKDAKDGNGRNGLDLGKPESRDPQHPQGQLESLGFYFGAFGVCDSNSICTNCT